MSNSEKIGIYKITSPTGKVYIGQSIDIPRRFKEYINLKCHQQPKLYYSLKKYGAKNHIFETLETCSANELDTKEIFYKLQFNTVSKGLNCELYDSKGGPRSKEVRLKISNSKKGTKGYPLGQPHTETTKILKSQIAKGKPKPKGFGSIISQLKKGKLKPTQNKSVIDNNTGVKYNSVTEAAAALGVSLAVVSNSLSNKYKTSKHNFSYGG